ncbi:MAG: hypothetical protein IKF39_02100 [Oscillospiraceae bacterium]|nr:hypothetical protein [Oscillospiraceae bacterium]
MAFTQVIGKTMPNGFAGSYSRQPDTIIDTHPAGGAIPFGAAVVYSTGSVVLPGASAQAGDFVGVAVRETKSATNYAAQNAGSYAQYDAVPVIKRGCVNVVCQRGTAALDGTVYLRVAANASYPNCVVGGFEASADSTNTVALTNAKWKGAADANGIAEMRILTTLHA